MPATVTPADVLATLSHRYREHYGDRFVGLHAVPEFPFSDEEPEPGPDDDVRAVEVIVVLKGPYDPFEETDPVVDLAMEVTEEYDWWMSIHPLHTAHDSSLADWARERGVEL